MEDALLTVCVAGRRLPSLPSEVCHARHHPGPLGSEVETCSRENPGLVFQTPPSRIDGEEVGVRASPAPWQAFACTHSELTSQASRSMPTDRRHPTFHLHLWAARRPRCCHPCTVCPSFGLGRPPCFKSTSRPCAMVGPLAPGSQTIALLAWLHRGPVLGTRGRGSNKRRWGALSRRRSTKDFMHNIAVSLHFPCLASLTATSKAWNPVRVHTREPRGGYP